MAAIYRAQNPTFREFAMHLTLSFGFDRYLGEDVINKIVFEKKERKIGEVHRKKENIRKQNGEREGDREREGKESERGERERRIVLVTFLPRLFIANGSHVRRVKHLILRVVSN